MGWLKKTAGFLATVAKGTVKGTAAVAYAAKDLAVRHQDTIAKAGSITVKLTGKAVSVTGRAVSGLAGAGARAAYGQAATSDSSLAKAAGVAAGLLAEGVEMVGKGTTVAGGMVDRSGPALGASVGGVVAGGASLLSEAVDSVAISQSDLNDLRAELGRHGSEALERSKSLEANVHAAIRNRRKCELLDLYVVGGVSLLEVVRAPGRVPPEVQEAYSAAYPDLAAGYTFAEAVQRLGPEQLPGLVAGVKGKLFEMHFVDHLNDGGLPNGYEAILAGSATQAGWDIQILDANGQVAEVLQAKATESASYVREALERYPDIDVVSTSEVYAQMAALGYAEQLRDGGISEAALETVVGGAVNTASSGVDVSDLLPSALGLAVIGLSVFMDKTLSAEQRAAVFGERSGRAGMSSMAGKVLMVATQTWWIGLIGGVGSHWLSTKGRGKRERLEELRGVVRSVRLREARMAQLGFNPG